VTATAETRTLRYQHAVGVTWRSIGGSVLLKVRDKPDVLALDGPGAALWAVLARPRSLSESAAHLSRQFTVPAEQIEQDIAAVVEELAARGALETQVGHP
jgi:hypothetical protein